MNRLGASLVRNIGDNHHKKLCDQHGHSIHENCISNPAKFAIEPSRKDRHTIDLCLAKNNESIDRPMYGMFNANVWYVLHGKLFGGTRYSMPTQPITILKSVKNTQRLHYIILSTSHGDWRWWDVGRQTTQVWMFADRENINVHTIWPCPCEFMFGTIPQKKDAT